MLCPCILAAQHSLTASVILQHTCANVPSCSHGNKHTERCVFREPDGLEIMCCSCSLNCKVYSQCQAGGNGTGQGCCMMQGYSSNHVEKDGSEQ